MRAGRFATADVRLVNGAVFNNLAGGRVEGIGTIQTAGSTFTNREGLVSPGLSIGRLIFDGNFAQQAGGTIEIEIAGPTAGVTHDQVAVTGTALLDGKLDISTTAAVDDPTIRGEMDTFTLMTVGAFSGAFGAVVYDDVTLVPAFAPTADGSFVAYAGENQNLDPGLFRIVTYAPTELLFTNYLAIPGDANGDGTVDVSDFNIWNANKFTTGTDWVTGDFDNDGVTDVSDYNIWNSFKFTGVTTASVPEPTLCWLFAAALLVLTTGQRKQP